MSINNVSCMGRTKGVVSYGGFTHVKFPLPHFLRPVSNYHYPLSSATRNMDRRGIAKQFASPRLGEHGAVAVAEEQLVQSPALERPHASLVVGEDRHGGGAGPGAGPRVHHVPEHRGEVRRPHVPGGAVHNQETLETHYEGCGALYRCVEGSVPLRCYYHRSRRQCE